MIKASRIPRTITKTSTMNRGTIIILRDGCFVCLLVWSCLYACLSRWMCVGFGGLAGGPSVVTGGDYCRTELLGQRVLGRSGSARTRAERVCCGCDAVYKKSKGAHTTVRHDLALSGFNLGCCPGGSFSGHLAMPLTARSCIFWPTLGLPYLRCAGVNAVLDGAPGVFTHSVQRGDGLGGLGGSVVSWENAPI